MIELNEQAIESVDGAGFFRDMGKAIGEFFYNFQSQDVSWYSENADAIRAADSSGLM